MGQLLCQFIAERVDAPVLLEILRYDWLRCGHRFLPPFLQVERAEEQPQAVKDALYQQAAAGLSGLFNGLFEKGGRNHFFKTGFFLRFSGACLRELGLSRDEGRRVVMFLSDREESVYRLHKIIVLPAC
jgi:hypothetical protein